MNLRILIRRSLLFHWRSHAAVTAGIVIAASTLTGALLMGDSMRGTLRQLALARLAGTAFALNAGDRTFDSDLETRLNPDATARSLLVLPGTATLPAADRRANQVQIIGANSWGGQKESEALRPGEVLLNAGLASLLQAAKGDEVILRFAQPRMLPGDSAMSLRDKATGVLRLQVAEVLTQSGSGDFTLDSRGTRPLNAFVNLTELSAAAGLSNKANIVLVSHIEGGHDAKLAVAQLQKRLKTVWRLADLDLQLASRPEHLELRSKRVFLEPPVVETFLEQASTGMPILTYLANLTTCGTNFVSYSMVTAAGPPYTPADLRDDEIVLNDWMAKELRAEPGSRVQLVYFRPDSGPDLVETTNEFRVRGIVPLEGLYLDPTLMPDFPGLEEAESTQDWETGFPLRYPIRSADDDYWKAHRGTPKAFVSSQTGQQLWANRFGRFTAVRATAKDLKPGEAGTALLARMEPAQFGLQFTAVREQALQGVNQAQDFGQLFLGFSFFLVVAALLLTSLLLRFGLEQRSWEFGLMAALGFSQGTIKRWQFLEHFALAVLGSLLGAGGGVAFAQGMIGGMNTVWNAATGGIPMQFHWKGSSVALGFAVSLVVAAGTIWFGLRQIGKRQPVQLLSADGCAPAEQAGNRPYQRFVTLAALAGSVALLVWGLLMPQVNPGLFFGAGACMLAAGFSAISAWMNRIGRQIHAAKFSLVRLGIRSNARNQGRSLAVVTLLSLGTFVVVAISIFRLETGAELGARSSGTGGFALLGQTSMPLFQSLNTIEGRRFYGLEALPPFEAVAMRMRKADQADCLNPVRSLNPTVLGVRPEMLEGRFKFASRASSTKSIAWRLLRGSPSGPVPVIGDANSIQWSMGKKVGDVFSLPDERGNPFDVQLVGAVAGSILQGYLLMDEAEFVKRFPGRAGAEFFLIDAAQKDLKELSTGLTRGLQDFGFTPVTAAERLAEFNAVQNTYLATFQALGGLGLLLGSVGLGIIVLRNVLERRAELAVLLAVGFTGRRIRDLVALEHLALLALGLGLGVVAGGAAVVPAVIARGTPLPWGFLVLLMLVVFANGAAWALLATRFALRGTLLTALRNE